MRGAPEQAANDERYGGTKEPLHEVTSTPDESQILAPSDEKMTRLRPLTVEPPAHRDRNRITEYSTRHVAETAIKTNTKLIEDYNRMALVILKLKKFALGREFKKDDLDGITLSKEDEQVIDGFVAEAMQAKLLNNDRQTGTASGLRSDFERLLSRGEQALSDEISKWTQLAFGAARKLAVEKKRLAEIDLTPEPFHGPQDGAVTKVVNPDELPDRGKSNESERLTTII